MAALPELVSIAPPYNPPLPFSVNALAAPRVYPASSSTAPELIVTVPRPSGLVVAEPDPPTWIVPPEIVIAPALVLLAPRISVPEPNLLRPTLPVIVGE